MMTMMVQCNATPLPVNDDARHCSRSNNSDGAACSTMGCSHPHMQLVRCNAMAWTDETEEGAQLKVLVTRSDPVEGTMAVTEEEAIPRSALTGTAAERRYMERKWC
jgi:hypothetical protein